MTGQPGLAPSGPAPAPATLDLGCPFLLELPTSSVANSRNFGGGAVRAAEPEIRAVTRRYVSAFAAVDGGFEHLASSIRPGLQRPSPGAN
jgi:hypothetical protein